MRTAPMEAARARRGGAFPVRIGRRDAAGPGTDGWGMPPPDAQGVITAAAVATMTLTRLDADPRVHLPETGPNRNTGQPRDMPEAFLTLALPRFNGTAPRRRFA